MTTIILHFLAHTAIHSATSIQRIRPRRLHGAFSMFHRGRRCIRFDHCIQNDANRAQWLCHHGDARSRCPNLTRRKKKKRRFSRFSPISFNLFTCRKYRQMAFLESDSQIREQTRTSYGSATTIQDCTPGTLGQTVNSVCRDKK